MISFILLALRHGSQKHQQSDALPTNTATQCNQSRTDTRQKL